MPGLEKTFSKEFDKIREKARAEKMPKIIESFKNPNDQQKEQLKRYEIGKGVKDNGGIDCGPCNCAFCGEEWYGRTQGPQICIPCTNLYENGHSLFPYQDFSKEKEVK